MTSLIYRAGPVAPSGYVVCNTRLRVIVHVQVEGAGVPVICMYLCKTGRTDSRVSEFNCLIRSTIVASGKIISGWGEGVGERD